MKYDYLIPDCRDFAGYKPCHPGPNGETCIDPQPTGTRILLINIGALGAVLNTTSILPALKREYPESTIHWLTMERAVNLLMNNPLVDFIHPLGISSILQLQHMKFDIVINLDKTQDTAALTNSLISEKKLGFGMKDNGVVVPLNDGAVYNYRLGIDDKLKFSENKRTTVDILRETCDLDRTLDPYVFRFTEEEKEYINGYRNSLKLKPEKPVIGINTGSSPLFKYRRIPETHIRKLIPELYELNGQQKVVLLGGLEDAERNAGLERDFKGMIINTPTDEGLRRGMCYVDVCDYVFSGDTLGAHMSIALGKTVIMYFNISCAPEIELYGKGVKVLSEVECSPCWKSDCDMGLVCLEEDISSKMLRAFKTIF